MRSARLYACLAATLGIAGVTYALQAPPAHPGAHPAPAHAGPRTAAPKGTTPATTTPATTPATAPTRQTGSTWETADIPAAVRIAAEKYFVTPNTFHCAKQAHGPHTWFAATGTKDGFQTQVCFIETGEIAMIEKVIPAEQLPAAVKSSILKQYPNAKISDATCVEHRYFDVQFTVDGQMQDVEVFGNGLAMSAAGAGTTWESHPEKTTQGKTWEKSPSEKTSQGKTWESHPE